MKFAGLVWSNLKRRKLRTALTILSVLVAFLLFSGAFFAAGYYAFAVPDKAAAGTLQQRPWAILLIQHGQHQMGWLNVGVI